ncbi:hypothetical protein LTR08_008609 [Meristemomyces frigidus]|nr:hypothetical protein LTR08_008609 [Meristemomyces frigidus]
MPSPGIVDVAAEGDVILVCGGGPTDTLSSTKIRVSAAVLSNASSVFKAMLRPQFKEGLALASASSAVEIPLPADDGEAMKIMCQVIHLRNDVVPKAGLVSAAVILGVAELGDKYDCIVALEPTARHWLAFGGKWKSFAERRDLLTAAYHFGDGVAFADIGRSLITNTSRSDWESQACDAAAPLHKVFGLLEAERKVVLSRIVELMDAMVEAGLDVRDDGQCSIACRYSETFTGALIDALRSHRLWPNTTIVAGTVDETLLNMEIMNQRSTDRCGKPCGGRFGKGGCVGAGELTVYQGAGSLGDQARGTRDKLGRLCLVCIHEHGKLTRGDCDDESIVPEWEVEYVAPRHGK